MEDRLMKKIIILILLVSTPAFSQVAQLDPKLFENMYKECTTQRNNTAMLSDYHAAINANLKKRIEELETKLKEFEK